MKSQTLGDMLGSDLEEKFLDFEMSEVQNLLAYLQQEDPFDIMHAELLQQKALQAADILSLYLGKMVKTVSYLEGKVNSTKNRASLNYQAEEGKTTAEMKKWAGDCSPEVEELLTKLSVAKGSKIILEKKYDILIKSHHHFKDIAAGLRRTMSGYNPIAGDKTPEGYE